MKLVRDLRNAQSKKKDEFYTQLTDIEKELMHYRHHFENSNVYCNCDDPTVSNFFKYFKLNFIHLKLKKLITTCYKNQNFDLFSQHDQERSVGIEITGDPNSGLQQRVFELKGDGDFRSQECVELLKQADIVVTNPPFSLFREYVAQLIQYSKRFLIIGNVNAITYKDFFPLLKDEKVWIGQSIKSGDREFQVPDHYPLSAANSRTDDFGNRFVRVKGVRWFTNLDYKQRHEELILYKGYSPEHYPTYYNFNAINVNMTKDIPFDYEGIMGVPITFLDKHSPEQFEIIGLGIANLGKQIGVKPYTEQHRVYRKEVQKRGTVDGDLYLIKDGEVIVPYARILVRNKRL